MSTEPKTCMAILNQLTKQSFYMNLTINTRENISVPTTMNIRIKTQRTSAQIVASIDDLLLEILLRVPIRSLLWFKCVSKHWLSLITNPQFALLRNPKSNPALGLFLPGPAFRINPKFEYIDFNPHNPTTPPFTKLKFTHDPSGIQISQSCNGLLLCSTFRAQEAKRIYYVYNPTRKQFTTLPKPGHGTRGNSKIIHGLTLAFDPSRSPHYKVVCVRSSDLDRFSNQIEIYSSDSGPWRVSGEPFTDSTDFRNGVYWNGAVHWVRNCGDMISLYFKVDEERIGVMPMPPVPDNWDGGSIDTYLGESCDHLHLIELFGSQIQFNVYEMKRDYSVWFVKYHVDLEAVTNAFPGIVRGYVDPDIADVYYAYSIFSLIRGEKEEDAFLVLQIPGKAIRYNLVGKTIEKLCDFEGADEEVFLRFNGTTAYQYIESLFCV